MNFPKQINFRLIQKDEIIYDENTNNIVAKIDNIYTGLDHQPIDINGEPLKLKQLGYNPTLSIDDILNDIINLKI
jgi:GDP-D-mannose dehydratase